MATTDEQRPGRNDPCHCGSGKKYKQCCLAKDETADRAAHEKLAADVHLPSTEPPPTVRPPKHQTHQPWKQQGSTHGFVPKVRTPRKVGGS